MAKSFVFPILIVISVFFVNILTKGISQLVQTSQNRNITVTFRIKISKSDAENINIDTLKSYFPKNEDITMELDNMDHFNVVIKQILDTMLEI